MSRTIGMGTKPKTDAVEIATEDTRTDSAVKKENTALKKANTELSKQVETLADKLTEAAGYAEQADASNELLTAKVAELEAAAAASDLD